MTAAASIDIYTVFNLKTDRYNHKSKDEPMSCNTQIVSVPL